MVTGKSESRLFTREEVFSILRSFLTYIFSILRLSLGERIILLYELRERIEGRARISAISSDILDILLEFLDWYEFHPLD